jgi:hypothetical protein
VVLRLGALARRLLEQRLQLLFERRDPRDEAGAVAVAAKLLPGLEQAGGDRQSGLAEPLLSGEPLAVGGEVPDEVRLMPTSA